MLNYVIKRIYIHIFVFFPDLILNLLSFYSFAAVNPQTFEYLRFRFQSPTHIVTLLFFLLSELD